VNGRRILLKPGLCQGPRGEFIGRNRRFPFAPSKLTAAGLSHADIDHVGKFPNRCPRGFVEKWKKVKPKAEVLAPLSQQVAEF
jgi:Cft2 family RNA processing exonuclease